MTTPDRVLWHVGAFCDQVGQRAFDLDIAEVNFFKHVEMSLSDLGYTWECRGIFVALLLARP